jgi:hypothetical protein
MRHDLQACRGDGVAAPLAGAVGALVESPERLLCLGDEPAGARELRDDQLLVPGELVRQVGGSVDRGETSDVGVSLLLQCPTDVPK